jgi:cell division protein FtsW
MNSENGKLDWFMFSLVTGLSLFGVVMVYSASAMISLRETENETAMLYFLKQLVFTVIGLGAMFAVSRFDYRKLNNIYVVVGGLVLTVIFLSAVFNFPPINGARRWIRFGGFSFQPSELAKITVPIFLAWLFALNISRIGDLLRTVLPAVGVTGLVSALIVFEPDLGTTVVLGAVFVLVYFAAGARWPHIGAIVGVAVSLLGILLLIAPWRVARLIAFLDPCSPEQRQATGYQICQSLMGIGSGGVLGEGFALGQQKLFYLPYPYSDFIFATVGEELGLVGTGLVVIAFGLLLWRGAVAALYAPDRFGMLLGFGIITGIIVQALFNISVVISILPAKGIPLPFISYGGTSVVMTLIAVGVLLNIASQRDEEKQIYADDMGRTPIKRTRRATVRRKVAAR